jgi:predicted membrane channel-forming protein YqfA (hemolysin III family)
MRRATAVAYGAVVAATLGMMLIVAGVIATGFFMAGVVLTMAGLVAFAVAAVLHALEPNDAV